MITQREGAIISAYTGYLIGSFSAMHEYVEEIIGRPILTHEFADKEFTKEIHNKSKDDFINIEINDL